MQPADTAPEAAARQREAFRAMTPERRVELAVEMSDQIRAIAESGIRARHPELSDREVRDAVADLLLGRELADRARRGVASAE
jgi:hypothetical protein